MLVKRQDLLLTLTMLKAGLAKKEIIEQSKSYLITGRGISAYNDDLYAFAPFEFPENMTLAVPSDELLKLISRMPDEELDISIVEGAFVAAGKNRKGSIIGDPEIAIPIDSFHETMESGKWFKLESHFAEHLKTASLVASRDMNDNQLCYVHVSPGSIEATDRQKACRMNTKTGFKSDILIEYDAAGYLDDISPTTCLLSEEWTYFRNESGIVLGCRHRLEKFPDIDKLFTTGDGKELILPSNMDDVVDRAEIFSKDDSGLENIIKITLKENKIIVSSATTKGNYREVRKIKYMGNPVSFCVNPFLLKELLEHGKQVFVCDGKLALSINDFNFVICLQDSE